MSSGARLTTAVLAVVALAVLFGLLVPAPIPFRLDFQVLWHADVGVLRGIALYDRPAQVEMYAEMNGRPAEEQFVLPFPYPPWFATLTLPLGLMRVDAAARTWLLLNAAMLAACVWMLSDGWPRLARLAAFPLAALFPPVFGALYVGQFVFPTLLGMGMLVRALRQRQAALLAVAAALITIKPHVGIFVLAGLATILSMRRDEFSRRALRMLLLAGVTLAALGFVADGRWPLSYPASLREFSGVSECQLCVSMPMTVASLVGASFDSAALIAVFLLVPFIAALVVWRRRLANLAGDLAVALMVCIGLLVNPYLQNYDFAFLVVPFMVAAGRLHSLAARTTIGLALVAPWAGLVLLRREGSIVLLASAIILAVLIFSLTLRQAGNRIAATE